MIIFSKNDLISQQVLVNTAWEASFGNPSYIDWSASAIDPDGNLLTTGHTVISATQIALLLYKQNPDGATVWQKQFTLAADSRNYGIAIATDNAGAIYVAGACSSGGQYDMLLLKYHCNGTKLWHKTYGGSSGGDDMAVAVTCTASGSDVYVTGPSEGTGSQADYLTLRLDGSTGATVWEQHYNYPANLNDIPAAISFDASGKIVVAGGSATDSLNYDIMTLKYNASGTLADSLRIANPGDGFDLPGGLFRDNAGYLYITGSTTSDGIDYDIQTVKLNQNLDLVWKKIYDDSGLDDRGTSVCVNSNGQVYVAGYTTVESLTKTFVAIKYNASGSLLWVRQYGEEDRETLASDGMLDAQGNLILTGVVHLSGHSSWLTVQYDADGNVRWVKEGEETTGTLDKPVQLGYGNEGSVYVTGIKYTNGTPTYTSVKYTQYERQVFYEYQYEPDTVPLRVSKELIIRFRPEVLDSAFVNDPELRFGDLDAVVTDGSLIAAMDSVLEADGAAGRWKLLKIFPWLTTAAVTLTSKSGRPVPLPSLWTAMILVPEVEGDADEPAMAQVLHGLGGIVYAQPNGVATGDTPNDPLYGEQHSLWDTPGTPVYDDAHINIEPAWGQVDGSEAITVAIFDSGIDFRHEDFGFLENETGYGSSVVNGGWSFLSDFFQLPLSDLEVPDVLGHGTNAAGIIGAIRNNDIGVAGIAGGDHATIPDPKPGIRLQGMMILDEENETTEDFISSALVFALENSDPLFDISNNSWGLEPFIGENVQQHPLLREVYRLNYMMGVITIFSRGNNSNDDSSYPACFRDDWVISTGASGTNGLLVDGAVNDGVEGLFGHWSSCYGEDMDIVAPGAFPTIKTTGTMGQGDYTGHSGTSAAAPHASGVAALVLEKLQDKYEGITPSVEDIEHYLEYGATDIIGTQANYPVGYEDRHGWGRLNAGEAVALADDYKPIHFSIDPTLIETEDIDFIAAFSYNYDTDYIGVDEVVEFPTYAWASYKLYEAQINLNICNDENNDPTGASIADLGLSSKTPFWIRNAYTYMWGPPMGSGNLYDWLLFPENGTFIHAAPVITDGCLVSAVLRGYEYLIYDQGLNLLDQLPHLLPGEERRFEFTLLVDDPLNHFNGNEILTGVQAPVEDILHIRVSPNPAHEKIRIGAIPDDDMKGVVQITNIWGQTVLSDIILSEQTETDISHLPAGLYFVRCRLQNQEAVQKFIKY